MSVFPSPSTTWQGISSMPIFFAAASLRKPATTLKLLAVLGDGDRVDDSVSLDGCCQVAHVLKGLRMFPVFFDERRFSPSGKGLLFLLFIGLASVLVVKKRKEDSLHPYVGESSLKILFVGQFLTFLHRHLLSR